MSRLTCGFCSQVQSPPADEADVFAVAKWYVNLNFVIKADWFILLLFSALLCFLQFMRPSIFVRVNPCIDFGPSLVRCLRRTLENLSYCHDHAVAKWTAVFDVSAERCEVLLGSGRLSAGGADRMRCLLLIIAPASLMAQKACLPCGSEGILDAQSHS